MSNKESMALHIFKYKGNEYLDKSDFTTVNFDETIAFAISCPDFLKLIKINSNFTMIILKDYSSLTFNFEYKEITGIFEVAATIVHEMAYEEDLFCSRESREKRISAYQDHIQQSCVDIDTKVKSFYFKDGSILNGLLGYQTYTSAD